MEISCEEDLQDIPTSQSPIGMILDFQKIHELGFSGIHLTETGAAALRFGSQYGPDFNSWDMESTVWLEPIVLNQSKN